MSSRDLQFTRHLHHIWVLSALFEKLINYTIIKKYPKSNYVYSTSGCDLVINKVQKNCWRLVFKSQSRPKILGNFFTSTQVLVMSQLKRTSARKKIPDEMVRMHVSKQASLDAEGRGGQPNARRPKHLVHCVCTGSRKGLHFKGYDVNSLCWCEYQ